MDKRIGLAGAATNVCRAALQRGELTLRLRWNGGIPDWKFGRRAFAHKTVQGLIEAGEAVRAGDFVRARVDAEVKAT